MIDVTLAAVVQSVDQCKQGTSIMSETIIRSSRDETEMHDLYFDAPDDALEVAGRGKEGGAFTLSFCSGLDTCPA
jgi:hypothetical protein